MSIKTFLWKTGKIISKNLPTILTVAGITTTTVATAVVAKKAYDAAKNDIYAKPKKDLELYKICEEAGQCVNAEGQVVEYDKTTALKDKAIAVGQIVRTTAKQFWLPATLSVGGITLTATGFGLMKKRYAAAIVLADATLAAFNKYRSNLKTWFNNDTEFKKVDDLCMHATSMTLKGDTLPNGKTAETNTYTVSGNTFDILWDETHPWYKHNVVLDKAQVHSIMQTVNFEWHKKPCLTVNDVVRAFNSAPNYPFKETLAGSIAAFEPPKYANEQFDFGIIFDMNHIEENPPEVQNWLTGKETGLWIHLNPTTTVDKVLETLK